MNLIKKENKKPNKKLPHSWQLCFHLTIDLFAIFLMALGERTKVGYIGAGLFLLSTVTFRSFLPDGFFE